MKCRSCGAEIAANALICYKCGAATAEPRITPPASRPRRSRLPWVGLVLLGLALAAVAREVACGSLL
ncbi:MAG: zinc-ribbon domain-containing protein [Vicinamibacterales bacterium]|jgi:hypothetical protein